MIERRGSVVVFEMPGKDQKIAVLVNKVTGIETAIDPKLTLIYYSRPGSRFATVSHPFDEVLEAMWPEGEE